jgi:DNA anti-recombination protein RmuC
VLFDDLQAAPMSSQLSPNSEDDSGLEATVDQAIAACGGDLRATIRALIVANEYLEHEVSELMKAVSHAYARGRFNAYSG